MKKTFAYFAALTALFAVSCNRIEMNEMNQEGTLSISLNAGDLETRADEEKQTAEEKKIDYFDYFFFSDKEGATLLKSGHQNGTTITFDTTSEEYQMLAKKSYLYVIANYPTAIPDGYDTLEELLSLPVSVSITEYPGKPFVMDSYDADKDNVLIELKATAPNEVRNQVVMMRRIAAKFVVNVTVSEYAQSADNTYWKPTTNTKDFYMYMVNALDDATLKGTPLVNSDVDESKFYTYDHKHADMTGADLSWVSAVSYAYPETFTAADEKAPYFKVQMPWVQVLDRTKPATGSNIGPMGTHQFYYKVLLPSITEITRNTLYTLNLTLDKVGGTQEDYVVVTGTDCMVTNWLSPSGEYTGYYSARFLDTARDIYYVYGDDEVEIPVTSSHPIAATVTSAKKYDFQNKGVEVNVNTSTSPYSITNNGKISFKLTHVLDNVVSHQNTYDCSPITFTVDIKHEDNKQPHVKTITIVQYPPVYIKQEMSNGWAFVNEYDNRSNYGISYVYNDNNRTIGSLGYYSSAAPDTGGNTNPRQYTIYVSVLPSNSTAIIGDPRAEKGGISNLGNNVYTNYRPTADNSQNIIAPAFKMASSYGKTSDLTFERAEERCAAYQENGYPAGRWRVPTVAEIDFVVSLSEYSHIPQLYNTGRASDYGNNYRIYDTYWAAGMNAYGGKDYNADTNRGTYESLTDSNLYDSPVYRKQVGNRTYYYTSAVRCVYDVWYWGEEQDTYHLTSWGGYQTD